MVYTEHQKSFICPDGVVVSYRYWSPGPEKKTPAVMILTQDYRCNQNIMPLLNAFKSSGYPIFIFDNGLSGVKGVDIQNVATLVCVAAQFMEHLKAQYHLSEEDIAVVSYGINATIAATWVHDYAPRLKTLILSSPEFLPKSVWPTVPMLLNSATKEDSPLFSFSGAFLKDLAATTHRIVKDAAAIHVPVLITTADADRSASSKLKKHFYQRLSSAKKAFHQLPYKDSEMHLYQESEKINAFIQSCFAEQSALPVLQDADKHGYTKDEMTRLGQPDKRLLKRAYWKINLAILKHIGIHAGGIKCGIETGFDSGVSLDYIYQNRAQGKNTFGKALDRFYLDNIPWRGARLRKKHVEELMSLSIQQLSTRQQKINIFDIAAGHGRYILNALSQSHQSIDHVLMRDFDDKNVALGNQLIQEKGLTSLVDFEQGDGFSLQHLSTLPKDRTLAIASGFYELFSDNEMVSRSLAGVAGALQEGGYLIYTGIPWHPRLEYMARVMTSHKDGKAWVLRRRTQLELDQLVAAAGFEKVTQRIDPWGIFSVSLARRVHAAR